MRERMLLECKYVLLSLVSLARWLPVGRGEERSSSRAHVSALSAD